MPAISLPIYSESYRPSAAWQQQLQEYQTQYQQLHLDAATNARLQRHLLTTQIWHNLQLSGLTITHQQITHQQVATLLTSDNNSAQESSAPVDSRLWQQGRNLVNALQYLQDLAQGHSEATPANLTIEGLCALHTLLQEGLTADGGNLRQGAGQTLAPEHEVLPAELLPKILANALDWFAAPSVAELHPVEQAWLVHLRLMELQPFDHQSGLISRLAASLYLQRVGMPPLIISIDDREIYDYALNNALQMITQPGIEFFARSLIRVYTELLTLATTVSA
jgi:Fic family protein